MPCSDLPCTTVDDISQFRFGRSSSLETWVDASMDYYHNDQSIPHYGDYSSSSSSSPLTSVSGVENSLGLHLYTPSSDCSNQGQYHYIPLPSEMSSIKTEEQSSRATLYSQRQAEAYYSDENLPALDRGHGNHYQEEEYVHESPEIESASLSCSSSPEPANFGGACKPFILKIAFLLSQPELYSDVARWDSTGTIFIITVSPKFKEEVLPELFSHSSQNAFTRQLTTYSFQHLKAIDCPEIQGKGKGLSIWRHPNFTRDDTSTLNRLVPKPSKARIIHSKEKVASSTLLAYSRRFLGEKR